MTPEKLPENTVILPTMTTHPLSAERVVAGLPEGMTHLVAIGWSKEGEFVVYSTHGAAETVYLIEKSKRILFERY